jgi:hypothetical protein
MPTLMQKIRLAIRGWNRRREEQDREFLAKNTWSSGAPPTSAAVTQAKAPTLHIDMDGLTVAYLDDSGHFQHYLDIESGEVIDTRAPMTGGRYRRIPSQTGSADRQAFLSSVEDSGARARLDATSPEAFRSELARDRSLERAWYNFKNDRAIAAIEKWLSEIGLK